MNSKKKLLSFILVITLIISSFIPAFADTPQTEGVEGSDVIDKLHALEIVKGRENGDFALEDTITRAEFCALAVRMLGLEKNADMFKSAKVFTDVSESAWYSGVVNMAYSLGLVIGVGDNKFEPERKLNEAEAITLMVRTLGYEPRVNKNISWPINYMIEAANISLMKGVTLEGSKDAATRGEVFKILDNALEIKTLVKTGSDTYKESDKTILEKNLNISKIKVMIIDSGLLLDSNLEKNEIKVENESGKEKIYVVKKEIKSLYTILNKKVNIYVNDKDEVIHVGLDGIEELEKIIVSKVLAAENKIKYIDEKDKEVTLTVSADAHIIVDYENNADLDDIDDNAIIFIEKKGKDVVRIIAKNYKSQTFKIVREYDEKNGYIEMLSGNSIDVEDEDVELLINGVPSDLDDLEKGDIIYTFTNNSRIILEAFRDVSTFKLTKVNNPNSLEYIYSDKTKMDVDKNIKFSLNNYKTITSKFSEELLNKYIDAYMNPYGEIAFINSNVNAEALISDFYVIESIIGNMVGTDGEISKFIKLVGIDGLVKTVSLDKNININDFSEKDYVFARISNKHVQVMEKLEDNKYYQGLYCDELTNVSVDNAFTLGRSYIKLNNKIYHTADRNNFRAFYITDNEIEVLSLKELDGSIGKANITMILNDGDVEVIFITKYDSSLNVSTVQERAIVLNRAYMYDGDKKGYNFELSNGKNYFLADNATVVGRTGAGIGVANNNHFDIKAGDIIAYKLNGKNEIKTITEIEMTSTTISGSAIYIKDMELDRGVIEVSNGLKGSNEVIEVLVFDKEEADLLISDIRTSNVKSAKTTDLRNGMKIIYNTNDGFVTEIIVISERN